MKDAELGLAQQVIDSLAGEFDPAELTSEYRQNLRQMLEAKLDGQEIARPEPVEDETPVVDLMEALRRSVEEVQESKPARRRRPPRRAAPARACAEERLASLGGERLRRARSPNAWSWAWKRVLSILPW